MIQKIIKWLKEFRPALIPSVICTIIFAGLALGFLFIDLDNPVFNICSYVIDACAAIALGLALWAVVLLLIKDSPKQQFLRAVSKHKLTARLAEDYTYRTMIISTISLGLNIVLSLSKLLAGWFYSSIWLMVLAGYYIILCISKAFLLRYGRQQKKLKDKVAAATHEWKAYGFCGIMLLVMTLFLQGVVIMIVKNGTGFSYNEIVVIAMAAYDFYCLGFAIVYMIRKRKNHSPIVNALKSISFATSLVAILSLQTAMFSSFSVEGDEGLQVAMNILTGTLVCLIIIGLGMTSIIKANKELKQINMEYEHTSND